MLTEIWKVTLCIMSLCVWSCCHKETLLGPRFCTIPLSCISCFYPLCFCRFHIFGCSGPELFDMSGDQAFWRIELDWRQKPRYADYRYRFKHVMENR
ncbi:hypothetical protein BDR04DRAFT_840537 [Suillus decipiens]|nr:hypothetical protein BDR04DRAFT_840537 [Suillus decipiens]